MGWLQRVFDPASEEVELAQIHGMRMTGGADAQPGWRRVTMYVAGEEVNVWFPGNSLHEVNDVVKAWLKRGDDDQSDDDDLSSRVMSFPQGDYLFTFRRSWVAGYRIALVPGDPRE